MPERLTEKLLRRLAGERPPTRQEYRDATFGEGGGQLVLRQETTGRLYWSFVYYPPERASERGKRVRRRLSIGRYPRVTLAEARRQAGEWEAAVEEGRDPGSAQHGERAFRDLWAEYLARYAKRRKKSWRLDKGLAERHILNRRLDPKGPRFGDLPAAKITRHDVSRLLDAILDEGHARTAIAAKSLLSGIFAFGADRGWLERSPVVGMRSPATLPARERTLDDDETIALWQSCRASGTIRRACALPLVLVTAQRPGEVLAMQRRELDMERALWTIPKEKTKAGREHLVPLAPLALRLLAEAISEPYSGDHLFLRLPPVAHRNRSFPVAEIQIVRDGMAERLKRKPEHWTPHDLRRTAYSGMTGLGIPRHVVEAVCSHAVPGVAGIYDRHDYLPEKTAAAIKWGQHLEALFSDHLANVLPLTR